MRLLIQDDIIMYMDVYVEYTFDMTDDLNEVVLYDYGIELTNETPIGDSAKTSTVHVSLRGFKETKWMPEQLVEFIREEHGMGEQ
jgi:hypothetical protein